MTKWEKEGYNDAMEKALSLLESALVELRKITPIDRMEFVMLDALRRDIAEFAEDPDAEVVESDDGTCRTCGGSGGGDYPGIYCLSCRGRGYHKQRVEAFE